MKSIQRRLVASLLVALSILFVAASALHYVYARGAFLRQFDNSLRAKIVSFSNMIEVEEEEGHLVVDLEFDDNPVPEFQASSDPEYFQVWRSDNSVFARSQSLGERDLPRIEGGVGEPLVQDIPLPDGRRGRAAAIWSAPVTEPGDEPEGYNGRAPENQLLMVMARSRKELDRALATLLVGYGLTGLLLGAGMTAIVRRSVTEGLLPLKSIAREAAGIDPSDLAHRFESDGMPKELLPITKRLNELLDRLQESFQRERRFNADVAHELRTPIAELRTLAEVALQRPWDARSVGSCREYFSDVLGIAKQMEGLIAVLLELVRRQSSRQTVRFESVDLASIVLETSRDHLDEARKRGIAFEFDLPKEAKTRTDPALMSAVVRNLFSNAITYAPVGGMVECSIRSGENGILIFALKNTNDKLTPEDLSHVFEPFWQKDPSRSGGEHSGLGLSLVRAYADMLGLDLQVSIPVSGFFEVTFSVKYEADLTPKEERPDRCNIAMEGMSVAIQGKR